MRKDCSNRFDAILRNTTPGVHYQQPETNFCVQLHFNSQGLASTRHFPSAVYIRLTRDDDDPQRLHLLEGTPCGMHQATGVDKDCDECKDYSDIVAVAPLHLVHPRRTKYLHSPKSSSSTTFGALRTLDQG